MSQPKFKRIQASLVLLSAKIYETNSNILFHTDLLQLFVGSDIRCKVEVKSNDGLLFSIVSLPSDRNLWSVFAHLFFNPNPFLTMVSISSSSGKIQMWYRSEKSDFFQTCILIIIVERAQEKELSQQNMHLWTYPGITTAHKDQDIMKKWRSLKHQALSPLLCFYGNKLQNRYF